MSDKRPQSKHKLDRRLGLNLWGRPKSPVNKREYGPGQHGPNKNRKLSDYGKQLMAKQKLKGYYGNIGERAFRRYYQEAMRLRGDNSENLVGLLESRLDSVVYRMKFAATPFAARQYISHGHIQVNGKRVTISSYKVSEGDEISLATKAQNMAQIHISMESAERDVPEYVEVDAKAKKGKFIRVPKKDEIPYPVQMEPNLVIEFYSR
ncbi:MAG: 30S ribosomal protein S4 [Alphaproteobacteria bacterium]|nr:30S ribosomal protein S4 [Alphaproteobacteria bacterium]USO07436.1 MAG: 30S ribosomal protein S4 [Rhodospirillales bacterium]